MATKGGGSASRIKGRMAGVNAPATPSSRLGYPNALKRRMKQAGINTTTHKDCGVPPSDDAALRSRLRHLRVRAPVYRPTRAAA